MGTIEFKYDLSIYPAFISKQWAMDEYHISRQTVINWINTGRLPAFSTPLGSSRPGWFRESFVGFLMGKSVTEGRLAAESGLFASP